MNWFAAPDYWFARLVFERGLAVVYTVAFIVAGRQFRGLLGARGLLPIPDYLRGVSFRRGRPFPLATRTGSSRSSPVGAALVASIALGFGDAPPLWGAMLGWLVLWALYASFVNVGQLWFGFGWEFLLLEAGFLAVFWRRARRAGRSLLWLLRWLLCVLVRRGPDQASWRPVLAGPDLSSLPLRDPADCPGR